jgi:5-methylthioadenosine/S-adenosylhomocysteine deaminase
MNQADLIISHAHILTVDQTNTEHADGAVAISAGKIVAVGESAEILARFTATSTVDARGQLMIPGLINTHTHVPMTLLRGIANDLKLMDWLQKFIFPAEAKNVTEEFVRVGTRLACLEMQLGGTTTFCDMYMFEDAIAEETDRAGMRAVLGQSGIDFPLPDNKTWPDMIASVERFAKKWQGHARINPAIAPHAPYTVSTEHLVEAHKLAQKLNIPYIIHVAEDPAETGMILSREGKTPVRYLHSIGVFDSRMIAAHMIQLDEEEIALTAKAGVGVAHNPESNMKLAAGVAKVPSMLRQGVHVGLGTDGAASNNDLDMFSEMNTAAKLHKVTQLDPTVLPAKQVLEMATRRGAAALHMENQIGSIEVGKRADLVLIDTLKPHLTPMYNATAQVVYSAKASDVTDVWIEGRQVVKNGKSTTLDQAKILSDARKMAENIAKSVDLSPAQ